MSPCVAGFARASGLLGPWRGIDNYFLLINVGRAFGSAMSCDDHASIPRLFLAALLPFGTLTSYLPQYMKISKNNSHVGVNLTCMSCGAIANSASLAAFFMLHYDDIEICCRHKPIGGGALVCATNLLQPLQLVTMYVCSVLVVVFYVTLAPSHDTKPPSLT